jgi:hypothetical protein
MKRFIGLLLLVFIGVVGWRVGGSLSSDAMSMAVGVLFGVLAGVPTALLLLASERRRSAPDEPRRESWGRDRGSQAGGYLPGSGYPPYPQQAPVIVLTGAPAPIQQPGYGMPAQSDPRGFRQGQDWGGEPRLEGARRQFKVVGEKEAWLDEW